MSALKSIVVMIVEISKILILTNRMHLYASLSISLVVNVIMEYCNKVRSVKARKKH